TRVLHSFPTRRSSDLCLDGEAAADVDGVQRIADFFQLAIFEDEAAKLAPVIGGVFDAGVDEEVQHLQRCFLALLDLFFVERIDRSEEHTSELQSQSNL